MDPDQLSSDFCIQVLLDLHFCCHLVMNMYFDTRVVNLGTTTKLC